MNKITINLDGSPVKAAPGATLLEIARTQGIEIPTLCYDPPPPVRLLLRLHSRSGGAQGHGPRLRHPRRGRHGGPHQYGKHT